MQAHSVILLAFGVLLQGASPFTYCKAAPGDCNRNKCEEDKAMHEDPLKVFKARCNANANTYDCCSGDIYCP
ncbi:hypothetical protein BDP81DRAFT_407444 [Colletotrichum phormii]|uniref:Uncharacterized protein n=1 Tax=Colletotrichum phormii TaxID=359342 RepID=A0AAI9ZRX8_9PEZI|nr:uncharacterized protein BDP81DRAFT_407444 [Colletotrichum phormii]KAK1635913.1 hypothetical protein BDP81DRAFT_407444 [Colletotrichum phormii]